MVVLVNTLVSHAAVAPDCFLDPLFPGALCIFLRFHSGASMDLGRDVITGQHSEFSIRGDMNGLPHADGSQTELRQCPRRALQNQQCFGLLSCVSC